MKNIILFCVVTLCFVSCSKPVVIAPEECQVLQLQLASISLVDRNGMTETISQVERLKQYESVDFFSPQPYQKVLRVYARDDQSNIRAYITTYHENGQLKQYLEVINNRAYGHYREWYPEGSLKLDAFVISGVADLTLAAEQSWMFDGSSQVWDEKGNILASIHYLSGVLNGCSLYFHSNGQIWKRVPFTRGQIDGAYEIYLENGDLLQTTEYANGIKHGVSRRFWSKDKLSAEEFYTDGVLKTANYFDLNGKLVASINEGYGQRATFGRETISELQQFKNGIQEGEVKVFDINGRIMKLYHIKNGIKHGEEIEYIETKPNLPPQAKISINWHEGLIQGLVKTWYDNGASESHREMSANKKNGMLTVWYKDGSIMMIEEYDQDKLIKGKYFKRGEKTPVSEVVMSNGIATIFDGNGNFIRKITYYNGKPQE